MAESKKLHFAVVVVVAAIMASSFVEKVAAVDPPAPSPTSGAAASAPALAIAAFTAFVFGHLFH